MEYVIESVIIHYLITIVYIGIIIYVVCFKIDNFKSAT